MQKPACYVCLCRRVRLRCGRAPQRCFVLVYPEGAQYYPFCPLRVLTYGFSHGMRHSVLIVPPSPMRRHRERPPSPSPRVWHVEAWTPCFPYMLVPRGRGGLMWWCGRLHPVYALRLIGRLRSLFRFCACTTCMKFQIGELPTVIVGIRSGGSW